MSDKLRSDWRVVVAAARRLAVDPDVDEDIRLRLRFKLDQIDATIEKIQDTLDALPEAKGKS